MSSASVGVRASKRSGGSGIPSTSFYYVGSPGVYGFDTATWTAKTPALVSNTRRMVVAGDDSFVVSSSLFAGTNGVRWWSNSLSAKGAFSGLPNNSNNNIELALSADSSTLACGGLGPFSRVYSLLSDPPFLIYQYPAVDFGSVFVGAVFGRMRFKPITGELVATVGNTLNFYNNVTFTFFGSLPLVAPVTSVGFFEYSPDGSRIAAGTNLGLCILNSSTGDVVSGPLQFADGRSLSWSSNGLWLACAVPGAGVTVYETGTYSVVASIPLVGASLHVDFSRDGALMGVSNNANLNLYNTGSWDFAGLVPLAVTPIGIAFNR